MRNLLGGVIGALFGTIFASTFFMLLDSFPEPFTSFYFIFNGAYVLELTIDTLLTSMFILEYLTIWIGIGFLISPFSKDEMNTIRTCLWLGVIIASFAVASLLLTDSTFWGSSDRNVTLLMLYLRTIIAALIPLVSSIPTIWIVKKLRKEEVLVSPTKIETICECGAVFKSKPLICAECGRTLVHSPTLSADSSS